MDWARSVLADFDGGSVLTSSAILAGLIGMGFVASFRIMDASKYLQMRGQVKILYVLGFISTCCPFAVILAVVYGYYSPHLHFWLFASMAALIGAFMYTMWRIRDSEHRQDRWKGRV